MKETELMKKMNCFALVVAASFAAFAIVNEAHAATVETVVTDAPGVAQAVVGPDLEGSDGSTLVAAVVPADGGLFDEGAVRRFCAERLPGALVPRRLVIHDRFPLTPSGKIDRSAVRRTMSETTTRAS